MQKYSEKYKVLQKCKEALLLLFGCPAAYTIPGQESDLSCGHDLSRSCSNTRPCASWGSNLHLGAAGMLTILLC